mgnify:CR=1 FL=1
MAGAWRQQCVDQAIGDQPARQQASGRQGQPGRDGGHALVDPRHGHRHAQGEAGGLVKSEAPIHISNVMLVDPETGEMDPDATMWPTLRQDGPTVFRWA